MANPWASRLRSSLVLAGSAAGLVSLVLLVILLPRLNHPVDRTDNVKSSGVIEETSRLPTIRIDDISVEMDGVELTWSLAVPALKPPEGSLATIFFAIDRREKGKDWETLARIRLKDMVDARALRESRELKGLKYWDGRIRIKTDYEYLITLGTVDPAKVAGPVAVRTLGLFEFSQNFSNIQGDDTDEDPPKAAQVYIKVVKFDPEFGKVEWAGIHKVGDKIGWGRDPDTGTVTSKHRVSTPKRRGRAEVDFDTGARIKEIKTDQIVLYEYKECTPTPGGCDGPKVYKGQYKVSRVVFIDEDQVQQVYEIPAGMGKKPDYLCSQHGGTNKPRESTEAEVKNWRSSEVAFLLIQADDYWHSRNPKVRRQAQEDYRKLLKEFSLERAVEENRQRIKERSEAEIED